MTNLLARVGTAILAASILLFCVLNGKYTFLLFFFVLAVVSLNEFYALAASREIKPVRTLSLLTGALAYCSVALYLVNLVQLKFFFFLVIPLYTVFITALLKKQVHPFTNIAFTLTGLIYTVLPVIFYISLAFVTGTHRYDHQPALGFLFLLWANDTGAYFAGMFFGKHRLLERVSPKKTWEGFAGGAVLALVVAYVISNHYTRLSLLHWFIISLLIIVFGTLGDLVESLYKRELDVKDSGALLPGHGGVLDRFDGMLLSAPFVFLYLLLFGG